MSEEDQQQPEAPLQDDQAAALAALQAGAQVATDTPQPGQAEPEPISCQAEADLVVMALAEGLHAAWPCLNYSPETRANIAGKLEPVLSKYGLNSEFFTRFGDEISLLSAVVVVGFKSWQMVKAAKAAPEAAKDKFE